MPGRRICPELPIAQEFQVIAQRHNRCYVAGQLRDQVL